MKKVLKPFPPFPETFRIYIRFDHNSILRDILQFDKTLGFLFGNLQKKNQNVIFQTPQE